MSTTSGCAGPRIHRYSSTAKCHHALLYHLGNVCDAPYYIQHLPKLHSYRSPHFNTPQTTHPSALTLILAPSRRCHPRTSHSLRQIYLPCTSRSVASTSTSPAALAPLERAHRACTVPVCKVDEVRTCNSGAEWSGVAVSGLRALQTTSAVGTRVWTDVCPRRAEQRYSYDWRCCAPPTLSCSVWMSLVPGKHDIRVVMALAVRTV